MAKAKAAKKTTETKTKASKKAKAAGVETNLIRRVTKAKTNNQIAEFFVGDSVNVFVKIKEGEKERSQVFKGVVIKMQGSGSSRSFTVRKISAGVGVERTFPFASPAVEKVDRLTAGQVRRSKLYYLRSLEGKAAKINSELVAQGEGSAPAEEAAQA